MRALTIGSIVAACVGLTAGTALLMARGQQSRPGEIGENRVLIENHRPDQAVPVRALEPLRVQGSGSSDPASAVAVRAVRQLWEYRSLNLSGGQDLARLLTNAGLEGWEAVGLQSGSTGTTVLLKRPR